MDCLICKSKLLYEKKFNAKEYGLDADGTISIYSCSNKDCNLTYELIQLIEPQDEDSEDYYIYGKKYLKFYNMNEITKD